MRQLGFRINLNKCLGCRACELACRNEYQTGTLHRRSVRKSENSGQSAFFYLSMACNHCENPACVAVCPNHCFKKRRDGIVVFNSINCVGCKTCIGACPFNAPKFNKSTGKVDKCNLCVDRIDAGLKPICVMSCITEALEVVDIYKVSHKEKKWVSEIHYMQFTNPSVRFIPIKKNTQYLCQEGKEVNEID